MSMTSNKTGGDQCYLCKRYREDGKNLAPEKSFTFCSDAEDCERARGISEDEIARRSAYRQAEMARRKGSAAPLPEETPEET